MPKILIATFAVLTLISCTVYAKSSDWVADDQIKARIIVEKTSISEELSTLKGAVEVHLEEGWHTYWRTSGEAGLPPDFNWDGSGNLEKADIKWPAPSRFNEAGFYTFGYKNAVTFPVTFHLQTPGDALDLNLALTAMICNEMCIPKNLDLTLTLPKGDGAQSEETSKINAAFRDLPHEGNLDTLKIDNLAIGLDKIVVTVSDSRGLSDETRLFLELEGVSLSSPAVMDVDDPETKRPGQKSIRQARMIVPAPDDITNLSSRISGKDMRVTLVNKGRAIEKTFSF